VGVRARLAAGPGAGCPDPKALRDLRRRLGAAPLKMLFEMLAGPLGWPRMPGVMFGRYHTVAFDGCRSVKVPDSPQNRAWLGKLKAPGGDRASWQIAVQTARGDALTGQRLSRGHRKPVVHPNQCPDHTLLPPT
jgi:hypothetical protein